MKPHDLYHVGIVVEDIATTMRELNDAVGVEWQSWTPNASLVEVWTPEGTQQVPFSAVYSTPDHMMLELVQTVEDTIWQTGSPGDAHHLGYWSDDLEQTAAHLEAKGFDRVASGGYLDHPLLWVYHQRGNGPYIEHVSRAVAPMILGEVAW
jgi:hypothetical protein